MMHQTVHQVVLCFAYILSANNASDLRRHRMFRKHPMSVLL